MSDESNYQRNRTSSDDELRDRIAGILADTYSPGGRGVQFEDVVAAEAIIDHIRTDEAVERVAEAIYRSHDSYTHFTAKPWDEMVKSKDRANKFRVKQDRKAAFAAIDALLGES